MVLEARTVEHHLPDAGGPGALGDELADALGAVRLGAGRPLEAALQRGGGGEGAAGGVVDDLGVDVVEAAEDRQAGTRGRAREAEAEALVALGARRGAVIYRDGETFLLDVQHQILAHHRQAHQSELLLRHVPLLLGLGFRQDSVLD